MTRPLLKAAVFITTFVICSINCDRYVGCLFNGYVCAEYEWCFNDHAFGQCVSKNENGHREYVFKLVWDNLLLLQQDMKSLYHNGYGWPHPFTQCIIKQRLEVIQYGESDDILKCKQYSKIPINRPNDNYAMGYPNQPMDVYVDPGDIRRNRDYYADIIDDYPRTDIRRNKLQGTPLYMPWMQGVKPQYAEQVSPETYGQPRFRPDYNTPERFRAGDEVKDKIDEEWKELQRMDEAPKGTQENPNKAYTEGGLVFLHSKGASGNEEDDEMMMANFMKSYDPKFGWIGFKRPERLDVKKPGPGFNTINNYVFRTDAMNEREKQKQDIQKTVDAATLLGTSRKMKPESTEQGNSKGKLTQDDFKTQLYMPEILPEEYKDPNQKYGALFDYNDNNGLSKTADSTYVHIRLKYKLKIRRKGSDLLKILMNIIGYHYNNIFNDHYGDDEITFQIVPNTGINTTGIALLIERMKNKFFADTGYEITFIAAGEDKRGQSIENQTIKPIDTQTIKDITASASVMKIPNYEKPVNYEWIFVSIAVVCAIIVSISAFIMMKKHGKYKAKFEGLIGGNTEVSKDYQDLCRARMSNKKDESNATSQRIASLSKDPDNSPSSRSSTSSWGEEPVLSNMDISTGHMVLAYMEDHLNNKNRLDSEWAALCAYEAEPCAVIVARKPDNAKKNRYINALPYDHARVVISEYANLNNCDYINASTITDHDPRNPAYIATQGPLPDTSADFWQMVWEQGCVVIVMLTRLVENDVALCHRYWPEEGSELYHIYEVHLVSEHIWCDDYLVRSFYLKNLKTGETRTVTQFHFLTWPDGGVPHTTKALLEFRRKVNKSFRGRSCPIVVHCSDGVSRTGSYCLLDMVLNRMAKGAKEIDIAATLEHIRDQRSGAVATKAQFQMVLAAVAEEVQAILKALPQQQTPQPLPPPPPPAQH
ncbi:Hypothetical protein CINCED_3A005961 [Cinara cedri]|uniref:Receptor-type tyrosine-protein phosphatase N2 n=3 Tax=Cinara cedri TaxID=506608 RepID=A0A5E4MQQ8_9HEMI|nr:Hypothetical protein CINCED_3A005961 [Cinara cedri]